MADEGKHKLEEIDAKVEEMKSELGDRLHEMELMVKLGHDLEEAIADIDSTNQDKIIKATMAMGTFLKASNPKRWAEMLRTKSADPNFQLFMKTYMPEDYKLMLRH